MYACYTFVTQFSCNTQSWRRTAPFKLYMSFKSNILFIWPFTLTLSKSSPELNNNNKKKKNYRSPAFFRPSTVTPRDVLQKICALQTPPPTDERSILWQICAKSIHTADRVTCLRPDTWAASDAWQRTVLSQIWRNRYHCCRFTVLWLSRLSVGVCYFYILSESVKLNCNRW